MITAIVSLYHKSQADVVLSNLLSSKMGLLGAQLPFEIRKVTGEMIEHIWDVYPDVFNGKFGKRPHRIITAFYALATNINILNKYGTDYFILMVSCLKKVNDEISVNGDLYGFNSVDTFLIEQGQTILFDILHELGSILADETAEKEVKQMWY